MKISHVLHYLLLLPLLLAVVLYGLALNQTMTSNEQTDPNEKAKGVSIAYGLYSAGTILLLVPAVAHRSVVFHDGDLNPVTVLAYKRQTRYGYQLRY